MANQGYAMRLKEFRKINLRQGVDPVTVEDVKFYNMKTVVEENGNLCPIEGGTDIPFAIERIFYIYGVPVGDKRGFHAHHKTEQLLICLSGKVEVECKDGKREKSFVLDSPQKGLYVPPMIWDETIYLTEETVLLSLCSTKYHPSDYIDDYNVLMSSPKSEKLKKSET